MNYTEVGVTLTDTQKQSIKDAYMKKRPITLRLSESQLVGYDKLRITQVQHNKLIDAKKQRRGLELKMSMTQVQKCGGSFLSAIIPIVSKVLPILGSFGLAAANGAISGATNKLISGSGTMSYQEHGLNLTDNQKRKLADGVKSKKAVTVRLSPNQFNGSDRVMLTNQQINQLAKHKKNNTGVDITFSATQLSKQKGGFLGALLAGLAGTLLPTIISKITGNGKKGRGLVLPGTYR